MSQAALRSIDVAILAGGLGTRLRPVLADRPKILAPIEGRPFIDYLFKWLAEFGASKVVLCLGHLAGKVTDYIKASPPPFDVQISMETEPAGTAGALRLARPLLSSDPVLVLNGDSFLDIDVAKFLAFHRATGAVATLACPELVNIARFGRVEIDAQNRILKFAEKDGHSASGAINGGVYLFSAGFLDEIASSAVRSLENDVLAKQPSGRLRAFAGHFHFIDIGIPETLRSAKAETLMKANHEIKGEPGL